MDVLWTLGCEALPCSRRGLTAEVNCLQHRSLMRCLQRDVQTLTIPYVCVQCAIAKVHCQVVLPSQKHAAEQITSMQTKRDGLFNVTTDLRLNTVCVHTHACVRSSGAVQCSAYHLR